MKLTLADFSELPKALKTFRGLVGTKAEYIECHADEEGKLLELRIGCDDLSARCRIPNVRVEDAPELPARPRFAMLLSEVEDLVAGKKGVGTIETSAKLVKFTVGKFEAQCTASPIRVLKDDSQSYDPDAPIVKKSKKNRDNDTSWTYGFPKVAQLGGPLHVKPFDAAFKKISLDDQTKGVFSKGAYFGVRWEPDRVQMVGYDTLHIGHYETKMENEVPVDENGDHIKDIVIPKAMAQKLAKALGDVITFHVGNNNDWLVATDGRTAVAFRTFEVKFTTAKVLKQVEKPTTDLFRIDEIADITTFSKRAEARSVATLSTRSGDVVFEIKGEKSKVTEPMEAKVITKGEELQMSAGALADCVAGLSGPYDFSASDRFLRMRNENYQFLVIRGVAK